MMKRLNLAGLPIQVRELITMDFTRENPCPPPGVPLREVSPPRPAPAAPSPAGSSKTEPPTSNRSPASKELDAKDRESNGRFAKGNRGGCGNPFARQVAAFRACLINSVTQDDFKAIVEQLVELAKEGELQAIRLLFSYLLGTPKPVVEPDELDLQEMHLAHQTAQAAEALQKAAPARLPTNDSSPSADGEDGRLAASTNETPPPPPDSAPLANGINREPCSPTTDKAPSTNRANGKPAAGVSKKRPSPNGPNRAREPEPRCDESAGGQAVEVDEKRT
jgi:hypothetical protein